MMTQPSHFLLVFLSLGITAPILADEPASTRFEFVETHMGSPFKIVLYTSDEAAARRASQAAYRRIAELDAIMTDYDPESELMKLCAKAGGPPVGVSVELFDILSRSQEISQR